MSFLIYQGYEIEQRQDGYVNGTAMCKANHRQLTDWLSNRETQNYIDALSIETGKSCHSLYVKVSEGFPAKTAYWLHPLLALNLGRWISPKFAIWCDRHIKVLIETGHTAIAESVPSDVDRLTKIEEALEELKELVSEQAAIASLPPAKPKTSKQRMQELLIELKGGLTVTQFSQAIKIDPPSLRRYLNGYSEPSLPRYWAIASYMNVSIDDLFDRIFP